MSANNSFLSLSELAFLVQESITDTFFGESYWVVAETLDVKNYPDRAYCFVTLVEKSGKDVTARMEAVIWSQYHHIIREFEFTTGMRFDKNIRLLMKVAVDYSPKWGLKLLIRELDSSFTIGNLELEKQNTLKRLVNENPKLIRYIDGDYTTYNKRLQRPIVIQRIALITAPNSDGWRDFRHELDANPYGYRFIITEFFSQVQGQGAEKQILNQLEMIRDEKPDYDAVVIVRGGGSQLDFGPFDTYELSLAIAGFPILVISGIGHERNVSITDLMSHLSVKTPTKAAAFLVEHNRQFEEGIYQVFDYALNKASESFSSAGKILDRLEDKLFYTGERYLMNRNHELGRLETAIRHLDPENTLARGFAMVMKEGRIITDPNLILPEDEINIRLKTNVITTKVKSNNEAQP